MLKIINKIIERMIGMKFDKNSGCTRVWVTLIMNGVYTYDQVPPLLNLRECVKEVLVEMGMMETE